MFKEAQKEISGWKQSDDLMMRDSEIYKKDPSKFDERQWSLKESDYLTSGIYKGDGLDVSHPNPYTIFNDKLAEQIGYKETPTTIMSADNLKLITTKKGLDSEMQLKAYNTRISPDPALQKSMVDLFIVDDKMSINDKKMFMLGDMFAKEIVTDQSLDNNTKINMVIDKLNKTDKKTLDAAIVDIDKELNNLDVHNIYGELLKESAISYGSNILGLHKRIGAGSVSEKPNIGYINSELKRARDKSEDEKEKIPLQTRVISFAGKEYKNYVDVSNSEPTNTTLTAYKLPKDAIKYVEKRDIKTGKVIPITVKGEEEKAVQIKNPIETKTENDYKVAGWDKEANVIRLVLKDRKDLTSTNRETLNTERDEESYMIPYVGNESIIQEIVKKEQGNTDYIQATRKYEKYKR
jgi:hypothetical protein